MNTTITWPEIALRLALTVLAGGIIGANRGEHGRPAGMRTTILVCVAASISMIQVNLLLGLAGRAPNSFITLDLMRLPLGILSGIGFIGGGAILRRDNMVLGVTTAATLWFVTVMGLCLGAGQIGLGLAALAIGFLVLTALKWIENRWVEEHHGMLTASFNADRLDEAAVRRAVERAGYQVHAWRSVAFAERGAVREIQCEVRWRARADKVETPSFLPELAGQALRVEWKA